MTSINSEVDNDTDTASESELEISESYHQLPEPLTIVYDPGAKDLDPTKMLAKCKATYSQIQRQTTMEGLHELETVTREQAKCQTWHIYRIGRITGSIFHKVITSRETSKNSLISQVMRYNDAELNVPAVKWGREMEDTARSCYEKLMKKSHPGFSLRTAGLTVKEDALYLAASPDGNFTCSCCGTGVLEIKCPYKYKEGLVGVAEDKSFCLDANNNIRKNHAYFSQVQLQMHVCDVQFCDFFIWTKTDNIISRVPKDKSFLMDALPRAKELFFAHILPQLITRNRDPSIDKDQLCKICERPYFGKMIKCPGCFLSFHYECVHIHRASKNWMCADCKKAK